MHERDGDVAVMVHTNQGREGLRQDGLAGGIEGGREGGWEEILNMPLFLFFV